MIENEAPENNKIRKAPVHDGRMFLKKQWRNKVCLVILFYS